MKLFSRSRIILVTFISILLSLFSSIPAYAASDSYYGRNYCTYSGDQYACRFLRGGGFFLTSSNGRDALAFQSDGNLVGRVRSTGAVWYQSYTGGYQGYELWEQSDGNIVIYRFGGDQIHGAAVWATNTCCRSDLEYRITMGGDGHFSVWYNSSGTWVRWKSFGSGP